jgi:hypothetical protein
MFYTILIIVIPIQIWLFYIVYIISYSLRKLYKCINKGVNAALNAPITAPTTTSYRPQLKIDKELVTSIIQIVKKVI